MIDESLHVLKGKELIVVAKNVLNVSVIRHFSNAFVLIKLFLLDYYVFMLFHWLVLTILSL